MSQLADERVGATLVATESTRTELDHLPVLDSVRGVAILLVVFFHATVFTVDAEDQLKLPDKLYLGIASLGWSGVDLFFVLSGFLITRILLHTRERPKYFRNFYARRVLRIFPLYYFSVLAYLAFAALTHQRYAAAAAPWLLTYTSNLVFVFDKTFVVPLTVGHFWSLAIEEQFYLLWPLLVLVLSKRQLIVACLGFFVLGFVSRWALVNDDNTFAAYRFTLSRFDSLSLGGAVAVLLSMPSLSRHVLRRAGVAVSSLSLAAMLVLGFLRGTFSSEDSVTVLGGISLLGLFFASALLLIVTRPPRALAGGSGHAVLAAFGRYSYGMYVFHQPIATAFIRLKGTRHMPTIGGLQLPAELLFLAVFAGFTLLVAMASYHFMEKPFLKLKVLFQ